MFFAFLKIFFSPHSEWSAKQKKCGMRRGLLFSRLPKKSEKKSESDNSFLNTHDSLLLRTLRYRLNSSANFTRQTCFFDLSFIICQLNQNVSYTIRIRQRCQYFLARRTTLPSKTAFLGSILHKLQNLNLEDCYCYSYFRLNMLLKPSSWDQLPLASKLQKELFWLLRSESPQH